MRYSRKFFEERQALTQASAKRVLEIIWDHISPESVIDVGCATGIWLAEARHRGVQTVCGVDGAWVPRTSLEIPDGDFIECDLAHSVPAHIGVHDLSFCIEVAEHLGEAAGNKLVHFLTETSDVVLFSAAVPGQGGTGHVNEQLQSYWCHRFQEQSFDCYDLIRPRIWNDSTVNVIYKQNMLIYAKRGSQMDGRLRESKVRRYSPSSHFELNRIHPALFVLRMTESKGSLCQTIRRGAIRLLRKMALWR